MMAAYYRERAREYDALYECEALRSDLAVLKGWLAAHASGKTIMEVAAGTGHWTAIAAPEAKSIGLINQVFADAEFDAGVEAYVQSLAAKSASRCKPSFRGMFKSMKAMSGSIEPVSTRRNASIPSVARAVPLTLGFPDNARSMR